NGEGPIPRDASSSSDVSVISIARVHPLTSSPALKGEVYHSFYIHGGNLAIYGGDELEEITLLVMFLFF
ncbi:MAG: hypothetical protein RXQ96_04635, partial [Thermocladium sp.]